MKNSKTLILIFLFIIALSYAAYWQFKSFHKLSSEPKLPKFEIPSSETLFEGKATRLEEFSTPDGELEMKYPNDWMKLTLESLGGINQEIATKSGAEILFFAQKFKIAKPASAFLIVQRITLENGETLEDIIKKIEAETEEQKGEMKFLKKEVKEKEIYFEAEYKKEGGPTSFSREKLILVRENAYLVSFIIFENNWTNFEKEANEILNSIQIEG